MPFNNWPTYFSEPFQKFSQHFQELLPNLLSALGLLAFGLLIAFLLRAWTTAILRAGNRLVRRRAQARGLQAPPLGAKAPYLMSRIVFWLVFLFFFAASIETLGQPVISDWSNTLTQYLPNVLAAALVVFVGIFAGNIVKATIERITQGTHISHGELLGRLSQFLILMTALLIAIDQLGIQIQLLVVILAIMTGMIGGGIALAFALGARTSVSNIISSHYITKSYRIGQTIRLGETEGRILDITLTSVIVESAEGIVTIPAQRFSQEISVLLKEGR